MVFTTLSTSLLLQKIVWGACCVGETIFDCKLLVFMHGMNMRVYCWIQLFEVPMPSKD